MIANGEIRRVTYLRRAAATTPPRSLASGLSSDLRGSAADGDLHRHRRGRRGRSADLQHQFRGRQTHRRPARSRRTGRSRSQHTYTLDRQLRRLVRASRTPTTRRLVRPLAVQAGDANNPPEVTAAGANPVIAEANVTEVTFSASVFDPDGDTLSYTWFFGDGSSAIRHRRLRRDDHRDPCLRQFDGAYSAYLEIDDGEFTDISQTLEIQVGEPTEVPVTNGLNLLLQSDIKIGLGTGNIVIAWLDGSGQGNNLFAQGDPQLEQNRTPTGQPAIVFDGVGRSAAAGERHRHDLQPADRQRQPDDVLRGEVHRRRGRGLGSGLRRRGERTRPSV